MPGGLQVSDLCGSARLIEEWFTANQRPLPWREGYDPYHVLLSEVMLQQTRMDVVLPFFDRFLSRFPTLAALAAATDDEVTAAWSGLGYYRRARMLRAAATEIVSRFGGTVPRSVADLLTLPGIGRYTAGAVSSVAWNLKAPIVDGNVARIVARLFAIDSIPGSAGFERESWRRATELVDASSVPRHFNQGLMEIGALICTPRKPSCGRCPVRDACAAYAAGRVDELPRKKPRKEPAVLRVPLYLITDGRGGVLMRRESGPLMHAMLHLPHGDPSLLPGPTLPVTAGEALGTFRHSITTRRVEFTVHPAELGASVGDRDGEYLWVRPDELPAHPHPSYVTKALRLWENATLGSARARRAPGSSAHEVE